MILYHVSPEATLGSIALRGVLPSCSQGKRKVSWWVSQERVAWAIAHVSARHHVPADEITAWMYDVGKTYYDFKRTGLPCTWACNIAVVPDSYKSAPGHLHNEDVKNPLAGKGALQEFAPPPEDVDDIPF